MAVSETWGTRGGQRIDLSEQSCNGLVESMCLKVCSLMGSTAGSDIRDGYVTKHSTWLKQLALSLKGPWGTLAGWHAEPGSKNSVSK